jgi:glycerate kinase
MAIIARARGVRPTPVPARDAIGRRRTAAIALLEDGTAVVEAAEAIGLAHLDPAERDVLAASSAGLADLVRAALDAGARRLVVCLGGSATVDGGLGLLRALGAGLHDADRRPLEGCGADVARVAAIDRAGLDRRLAAVDIVVAVDVTSPLAGPDGAAPVFGPQKGATPEQVRLLDDGLARLGLLYGPAAAIAGAGAAGGLGAALAFLGATARPGADLVMEETRLAAALVGAALLLTGEGKVDAQTAAGKTVARAVGAAVAAGVPAAVIGGTIAPGAAEPLYGLGACAVLAASSGPATLPEALAAAAGEVAAASRAICSTLLAHRY